MKKTNGMAGHGMISQELIEEQKKEFRELLLETGRENMDSLLAWLEEETDFYSAPASTNNHGAFDGGLLIHSLNVYKIL